MRGGVRGDARAGFVNAVCEGLVLVPGRTWQPPPPRWESTVVLRLVFSPRFLKNTKCSPCGVFQKQHTELIHVEES